MGLGATLIFGLLTNADNVSLLIAPNAGNVSLVQQLKIRPRLWNIRKDAVRNGDLEMKGNPKGKRDQKGGGKTTGHRQPAIPPAFKLTEYQMHVTGQSRYQSGRGSGQGSCPGRFVPDGMDNPPPKWKALVVGGTSPGRRGGAFCSGYCYSNWTVHLGRNTVRSLL